MVQDNYNILSGMLTNLKQQLSEVNSQIQYNFLHMKEKENFIEYPQDSYLDNFENMDLELNKKKSIIENKIEILEKVLKQESHNITALYFQEEDRKRIAGDLHDTSLQNLAHLVHKIELCSLYIDQDPIKAKLELSVISNSLKETVNEIRNIIFDLRPMTFDDLGFKACLERLLESINERKKYRIISDIDDVSCENDHILYSIYRVVQESLNNINKHAEAENIDFYCKVFDGVCMIDIVDDGKGFYNGEESKENRHFGLSLMKERIDLLNGKINIDSIMGGGTKIHMEIPLTE